MYSVVGRGMAPATPRTKGTPPFCVCMVRMALVAVEGLKLELDVRICMYFSDIRKHPCVSPSLAHEVGDSWPSSVAEWLAHACAIAPLEEESWVRDMLPCLGTMRHRFS